MSKTVESYFSQEPSPNAQIDSLRSERDELRALTKLSASQKKQLDSIESELFEMRREYHKMRALRAEKTQTATSTEEVTSASELDAKQIDVLSQLRDNIDALLSTAQKKERKQVKRVERVASKEDVLVRLAKMLSA